MSYNRSKAIKVNILKNEFKAYSRQAQRVYQQALNDCLDDIVRTSSQSAPHDKGILEKSWDKKVEFSKLKPTGIVSYSVKKSSKSGNYNYALRMHEDTSYELGEKSKNKTGGTGMSGKSYPVGTGYLGNVILGESATYRKHIEDEIKKFSRSF